MARPGRSIHLGMLALLIGFMLVFDARSAEQPPNPGEFIAVAYRDIEDSDPDQRFGGLTVSRLAEQFDWLKAHGYQPVSLDDLLAAQSGQKALPAKPILLTFDDGFESFYTRAVPLLRAFGYPAVLSVTATRISSAPGARVAYGSIEVPRETFMNWEQVREVARSGLVEVAVQVEGGPIGADANRIQQETGRMPRAMVWSRDGLPPSIGFPIVLTLGPGRGSVMRLGQIPRQAIAGDPGMGEFIDQALRARPAAVTSLESAAAR